MATVEYKIDYEDLNMGKNISGCSDPTAYAVIKNLDEEYGKVRKLLHAIFRLCEMAGFKIEGRVVLINKKTGKVWK